ncbi:MAG: ubiquinol-cytochrome C chaperone family protein [Pseudomonadota bacterium]|nr:ubiquinol-cytochrome C chaperone family protein [Pseudomonadota bacterium]
MQQSITLWQGQGVFSFLRHNRAAAERLYAAIVSQARSPVPYRILGVPDTLDGRFDLILLHMFLVLHALKKQGKHPADGGQALFGHMVTDMDRSLREVGVGDLSVGRKIRTMVEAFYGRIAAYEQAVKSLDADTLLPAALRRNLYGTCPADTDLSGPAGAMARYTLDQVRHLEKQDADTILSGTAVFLPYEPFLAAEVKR